MPMTDLAARKATARKAAAERRDALQARSSGLARQAAGHALAAIASAPGTSTVAVYLPMRSELDTLPVIRALDGCGYRVCLPVVESRGKPLRFRAWRPGADLVAAAYGVRVPASGDWLTPDVLLIPMLAFDGAGWRLGYGGGFYDRTLAALRAARPVTALGFAFAGQQVRSVPHDPATDARLDGIVTEAGLIRSDMPATVA